MPKSTGRSAAEDQAARAADPFGAPFEFLKTLWGGMQVPGVLSPTLAPNDIKKQIADLKAVECWLTLNMNILRTTIQTLEVQAATLATLSAMQQSMYAASQQGKDSKESGRASSAANPFFTSPFSFGMPPAAEAPATPSSQPAQQPAAAGDAGNVAMAAFGDPNAWWTLLQDQFRQTVDAALQQQRLHATAADHASGDKDNAGASGDGGEGNPREENTGEANTGKGDESKAGRKRGSGAAPKARAKPGGQSA